VAPGGIVPRVDLTHLPTIPIAVDGMSIEDVALFPLGIGGAGGGAGGAPPRPDRLVLTPRSAEACLMEGLAPDELRPKPPELFALDRAPPNIVQMVRCCVVPACALLLLVGCSQTHTTTTTPPPHSTPAAVRRVRGSAAGEGGGGAGSAVAAHV